MDAWVLQGVRYALMGIGVCLLVVGGLLLLWFGLLVQEIVRSPEEVQLIQYVAAHIGTETPVVAGRLGGEDFRLEFSETFRSFGFFFLGLLALSILSGIVKALVIAGVDILKGAMAMEIRDTGKAPPRSDVHLHRPST